MGNDPYFPVLQLLHSAEAPMGDPGSCWHQQLYLLLEWQKPDGPCTVFWWWPYNTQRRLAVICLSGAMGAMYTDAHTCPPLTPAACCSCSSLQGDPSCSQHSICSLPTVAAEKGKHKKLHLGLGKNSKKAKNSALLATHKSQFICPFVFIEAGREAEPPWKQTCLCCARSQI